ncbi:MAG TPA: HEAT repeat domain-containing protein [Polyangiaceae bacterium]|jgi:HEAT repeat protein
MKASLNVSDAERARTAEVDGLLRDRAVPALVERLTDPSWTVRRAVVSALARLGEPAVAPLIDVLRNLRDDEARLAAAVEALVASYAKPDDAILELLEASTHPGVKCDAIQVLGRRQCISAMARLGSLMQDGNDNVALAAIEAVGRIGGDASIELLITAVQSKSFFRAFPAIDVLGRTADPRVVTPLSALLDEPHYALEAARALGHAAQPKAVPALAALLTRPNDALTRVTAVALAEIHDRHTERYGPSSAVSSRLAKVSESTASRRLIRALVGADAGERTALCRVLGWIGEPDSVEALVELLDAEPAAAHAAALAIANIVSDAEPLLLAALRQSRTERRLLLLPLLSRSRSAVADVMVCLDDADPSIRAMACDTLGKIGDDVAVPRLFALLGDTDARVAQSAASAIQSLGGVETERRALEAARTGDPRVRRSALRILAYFGWPSSLEVFLAALDEPDERLQDVAAAGLAALDDERALGALIAASSRPSTRARSAAVRALGQTRNVPAVRERLRTALSDPDAWVRYYACQALSRLHDETAAEPIAKLLADPAGQVRVAAIEALARLEGSDAIGALHAVAESHDPDIRRAALLALGGVKSSSSLPLLRSALASTDPATRLVALSALAEFDEHEAVASARDGMKDQDESVRSAAITLLAGRPGKEATRALVAELGNASLQDRVIQALAHPIEGRVDALVVALRCASPEEAPRLVSALARMRRPEATAALEEAFIEDSPHVRRAVVPALAALGTATARRRLERAAREDVDVEVRELCAAVLGN